MPRKQRRTRLRSTVYDGDILRDIVFGPYGLDEETNSAIEKELAKCPVILERWRKQRAVITLPDNELVAASEQTENQEIKHWAEVELRVRIRSLKEQEMQS